MKRYRMKGKDIMKNRNKITESKGNPLYLGLVGLILAGMLGGCGDGQETAGSPPVPAQTENVSGEAVPADISGQITRYEEKYSLGEFTAQDYLALARLYGETGQIRKKRDLLEQSVRLTQDTEALGVLGEITVNLEEEDAGIRSEAERLINNLDIAEYRNEIIGTISSPGWMQTTMPKLTQGVRKYYMDLPEGRGTLYMESGYLAGIGYSRVVYTKENQVIGAEWTGSVAREYTVGLQDGQYSGDLDIWTCIPSTGDIYREKGTMAGGLLTGTYTAGVKAGGGGADLFTLWSSKEIQEYKEYTGEFDPQGHTLLEQPNTGEEGEARLVYAYDGEKRSALCLRGQSKDSYVFNYTAMGMGDYPVYEAYQPVEADADLAGKEIDAGGVKVRVLDGMVQWFDGSIWHDAGSVATMVEADPFKNLVSVAQTGEEPKPDAYKERGIQTVDSSQTGEGPAATGGKQETGTKSGVESGTKTPTTKAPTTKAPTTKAPTTKQPTTKQPVTPQTPTPSPTPDAKPTPTPAPSPEPSPAPSPAPSPEPSPAPTPTPAPTPDVPTPDSGGNSNDTDIEWTPDVL